MYHNYYFINRLSKKLSTILTGATLTECFSQNKNELIMDVNTTEVEKIIKNNSVDILIHGHTHRPKIHDENGIPRIVLGDWGDNLWYIKSSNGEIELLQEKI